MAIASNFPAIRPSLNLDFANAKALDPRITFSRASAATYYDGKTVAKAEENLLLNSAILATQSVTTRAEPYTLSFIGTGTVTLSGTSTAGPLVGTGAANRVSLTFTPTAGTLTLTVNGAVEQAQLEARSSATAYTPTTTQPITNYIPVLQTAPAGVPRFDHNPVTGESLGLLIEEQRANFLIRSQDFSSTTWAKSNAAVQPNILVSPDSSVSASKLVCNTGFGLIAGSLAQTISKAATATAYTLTVFAKRAELNAIRLLCHDSSTIANRADVYVSLVDGSIIVSPGTLGTFSVPSVSVIPVGSGWFRVSLSFMSSVEIGIVARVYSYDTLVVNGDGYSGIYIWGAQLEASTFPTSYIKTEASQATRAADSAAMTGSNFSSWYRQDEGTLFLESTNEGGVAGGNFGMSDGTNSNRLWVQNDTRTFITQAYVMKESILQSSLTLPGVVVNTSCKIAMAYKDNYLAATRSGLSPVTDNISLIPIVNKALFNAIGQETAATSSGWIRRAAYYPKRLTDAQLQALTA